VMNRPVVKSRSGSVIHVAKATAPGLVGPAAAGIVKVSSSARYYRQSNHNTRRTAQQREVEHLARSRASSPSCWPKSGGTTGSRMTLRPASSAMPG